MSTNSIRQKLHSYLEVADDKKGEAVYAIMENDIENSGLKYSEDLKNELDSRQAAYKNGKASIITADQSRKRIQKILKTARKR